MSAVAKIPDADLPHIIEQYCQLVPLTRIAQDYGCSAEALYKRIRLYCDSGRGDMDYTHLVTDVYVLKNLEAEEQFEASVKSQSMVQVTHANARCKLAQWHLERRRPQLYGAKQEVSLDTKVTVIVQRQPFARTPATMIEAAAVPTTGPHLAVPGAVSLPIDQGPAAGGATVATRPPAVHR